MVEAIETKVALVRHAVIRVFHQGFIRARVVRSNIDARSKASLEILVTILGIFPDNDDLGQTCPTDGRRVFGKP